MDYDNDGVLDFISGSYDPGDIYLFRGLGDGKYAKVEKILDENDLPLVHHPKDLTKYTQHVEKLKKENKKNVWAPGDESIQWRVASFGSWSFPVDWDNDKDLDILIGSFSGQLFLRENIGSREQPKYSGQSIQINAADSPLKETCHACPVVADWDGDGRWDLVVGSGDGSVGWYRNEGSSTKPKFGSRRLLVVANEKLISQKFVLQDLAPGESPVPGARAQICVTDYNHDGQLDLIVGDHSEINWNKKLSDEEKLAFDELKKEIEILGKKLTQAQQSLYGPDAKELDEQAKKEKQEAYQKITTQYRKLTEKKKDFYLESRSASFVWLYLGKSKPVTEKQTGSNSLKPNLGFDTVDDGIEGGNISFDVMLQTAEKKPAVLSVNFEIRDGWHMYAKDSRSGGKAVALSLTLPDGIKARGDWKNPIGVPCTKNPLDSVLLGVGSFELQLDGVNSDSSGTIEVKIAYQVCNEKMCHPPTEVTKKIKVGAKK